MNKIIIYWSRRDFRLVDNKALTEAVKVAKTNNNVFLPIFILEDYMLSADPEFQFGYPSRHFLANAIPEYANNFENFLILRGKGAQSIVDLKNTFKNEFSTEIEVHVNEDIYIDFYKQIDKLRKNKINIVVHNDQLTINRETYSGAGNLYSVFTPFKKAVWSEFLKYEVLPKVNLNNLKYFVLDALSKLKISKHIIRDVNFNNLWSLFAKNRNIKINNKIINLDNHLDFVPDFYKYKDYYFYNEQEAVKHFDNYLKSGGVTNYSKYRDSLEIDADDNVMSTSKISLPLCWGLISARYLKQEIQDYYDDDFLSVNFYDKENFGGHDAGAVQYISELIWREFYKYLFYHYPYLINTEFQERFRNKIIWKEEEEAIKRFISWIKGETGYPIVDAAMMQLAKTGWMHNRSRMIVASILTKNLGVDWRWGQEYFRAMLIDLDEASNNGGWQWGASVGADPKPIRIFNPYLQAKNYDEHDSYQNKWLDKEYFNKDLEPIIDHKSGREEALIRYGLDKSSITRDF